MRTHIREKPTVKKVEKILLSARKTKEVTIDFRKMVGKTHNIFYRLTCSGQWESASERTKTIDGTTERILTGNMTN